MKVKKMRTLETRSISTFSTRMTMFLASSAPSLSSLLKRVSILFKTLLNSFEPDFDDREGDGYEGGEY